MNRAWVFGRDEAEFIVDAFERDGAQQWMDCAADVRKLFGMSPYQPPAMEDARQLLRRIVVDGWDSLGPKEREAAALIVHQAGHTHNPNHMMYYPECPACRWEKAQESPDEASPEA